MLFAIAALFVVLTKPLETVAFTAEDDLSGTDYENTANRLNFIWGYLLIVVMLIVFIATVINTLRRPGYG